MTNSKTETTQNQVSHPEDIRTGLSVTALRQAFRNNLYCMQVRDRSTATLNDFYMATAYTVQDRLLKRWMNTVRKVMQANTKVVCYFSAEFLTEPHLGNNLLNLGIFDVVEEAFREENLSLTEMRGLRRYLDLNFWRVIIFLQ